MRTHLAKYGIMVELGTCLVALEQDTNCVTATITINRPGQTETRETVTADYLVGADGAKGNIYRDPSTYDNNALLPGSTRKLLGLTFQGETRDADGQVWGDVEIKGLTSDVCQAPLHPSTRLILAYGLPSTGTYGESLGISREY